MYVAKTISKKKNTNKDLTHIWTSLVISGLTYWLNYFVYLGYFYTNNVTYTLGFLIIVGMGDMYAQSMNYIAAETFNAKIANRHIPGTFMNVINAFGNLANE